MTDSLDEKVAIVTGGGSGIGEALSRELARRGARVVVADIAGHDAERVAAAIADGGGNATASRVDVRREDDVTRLVEETATEYGRLDYQFNNAGIAIAGDARDLTLGHWREVLDVDLNGVLYGTLAAYPIMIRQGFGHIVNTSSGAGLLPLPFSTPYSTAKHAVVGMSLSLRLEAAGLGVKVSVVCPGFVRTPIFDNATTVGMPRWTVEAAPGRISRGGPGGRFPPVKMVEPSRAARTIVDGVARNRPVIAFPGYVRWAWRLTCLFPRLADRTAPRQVREVRKNRV